LGPMLTAARDIPGPPLGPTGCPRTSSAWWTAWWPSNWCHPRIGTRSGHGSRAPPTSSSATARWLRSLADDCGLGSAPGISAPAGWIGLTTEPAIADHDRGAMAGAHRGQSPLGLRVERNARKDRARAASERICRPVDDAPRLGDRSISVRRGRSGQTRADIVGASPGDAISLFPPGPADIDGWRRALAHSPHLEPAVRRMADGVAARLDLAGPHAARVERLRLLGNGVVPLQERQGCLGEDEDRTINA
jgi:hypothetical protein